MKQAFLCSSHRKWLSSRPDQALHYCINSCETGWRLRQEQRLEEALPYVGCAFETAEILLSASAITAVEGLEWFLYTLAGLAQTLKKLGQLEDCKRVYEIAIARLKKESLHDAAMQKYIASQVDRIENELRCFSNNNQINEGKVKEVPRRNWGLAVH